MNRPITSPKKSFSFELPGKKRLRRGLTGLVAASAAVLLPHTGSGIIWDITPDDGATITPGSGTWDLDAAGWNNSGTNVPWTNGNIATFAGADAVAPNTYEITVGSDGLSAQRIVFSNSGYVLNAAQPKVLTLTLDPSVQVDSGKSATIGSNLTLEKTGGLTVTGGGSLTLAGTIRNIAGNLAITGGSTVEIPAGGQLLSGASFVLGPTSGVGTNGTLLVSGGTVRTVNSNSNGNFVLGNVAGVNAVVRITDGLIALDPTTSQGLRYGPTSTVTTGSITGTFHLDGGIVETRRISEGPSSGEGSITSTFNFNGGLLRVNGTQSSTFMSGLDAANVKAGGARIDTNGINATISQVLTHDPGLGSNPDGGLTKIGDGILTLSGVNTFTGPVKILGGAISVSSPNALGTSSNASANLLLDGGTFRFTGGSNTGTERGFTLGSNGGTIELAESSNIGLRFGGVITGAGNLTVTRGNENPGLFLGLSANNTYTGKTFVTNGAILEYRRATASGEGGSFDNGTEVTGATVRLEPNGSSGAGADQTYTEYFTLGEGGTLENRNRNNTVTGELRLTGNGSVISQDQTVNTVLTLSGKVALNDHTLTIRAAANNGVEVTGGITGSASGSLAVTATGEGAYVIVSGNSNTYQGSTALSAGELLLDGALSNTSGITVAGGKLILLAPDRINDLASLTMSGGTFETTGFSEDIGTFTLQGTATINLGSGASVLRFLDSSDGAATWNGTLSITNWKGSLSGAGVDQIFFGSDGAGLTSGQLAMIRFVDPLGFEPGNYFAQMLSTGEIVASAVPEPGTAMILLGGMGVLGLGRFRRRFSA